MPTEKHVEETKLMLPAKDVSISSDGHVVIKNPRLVEKLKATKIAGGEASAKNAEVAVVVTVGVGF